MNEKKYLSRGVVTSIGGKKVATFENLTVMAVVDDQGKMSFNKDWNASKGLAPQIVKPEGKKEYTRVRVLLTLSNSTINTINYGEKEAVVDKNGVITAYITGFDKACEDMINRAKVGNKITLRNGVINSVSEKGINIVVGSYGQIVPCYTNDTAATDSTPKTDAAKTPAKATETKATAEEEPAESTIDPFDMYVDEIG